MQRLSWKKFEHSSEILFVNDSLALNVVTQPGSDSRSIDLIGPDCTILRRTVSPAPLTFIARSGTDLVAVRNMGFPEVVVYAWEWSGTGRK